MNWKWNRVELSVANEQEREEYSWAKEKLTGYEEEPIVNNETKRQNQLKEDKSK